MIENTAEDVQAGLKQVREAFFSDKTRDFEWRKQQLRQLKTGFEENKEKIFAALEKDMKKDHFTTFIQEVASVTGDIEHVLRGIDEWVKPQKVDTPITIAPAKCRIVYQPLGAVCVIGAWNAPFFTTVRPLVTTIAAGNTALIKPSEMSAESSKMIRYLVENYLDNDCYKVVEGGAEVSIACTQAKWDLICFTGSSEKGKLVAQAAAKNLVPTILELGGKSITIIDETANINVACYKIIGAKFINSGQI